MWVARRLAEGRRVMFVTGDNFLGEWRERLGARFLIVPLAERSLYVDDDEPRFPSRHLAMYDIRPRPSEGGGAPAAPGAAAPAGPRPTT